MKLRSFLLLILCVTLFAGCAKKANDTKDNTSPTQAAKVTQAATATQAPTQAASATQAPSVTSKAGQSTTDSNSKAKPKKETTKSSNKAEGNTSSKKNTIKIAALKGPTAIGMVKLMDDDKNKASANDYEFTIAGTADEISAGLVKGDYDIAAIPCNLASILYNKTKKIQVAGINTLGVLYIVETGNSINSVKDLKGKTIYTTGLGTTPQYALNYILKGNGIDPKKDVNIVYKSESTEVASILNKSNNAIAMLPQPYVSTVMMQNKKVHISLVVADEWEKLSKSKSTVVTGVVAVNKNFLKKNKEAFNSFMQEYTGSINYVNTYVAMASDMVEKYGLFKSAPAKTAIPYCNITMITGDLMKFNVSGYLKEIYKQNPASVGGKLPDDKFYYFLEN